YSSHSSMRVTPGRLSSACRYVKSGCGVRDKGTERRYSRSCSAASVSSGGSGQAMLAARARLKHSCTVERAEPMLAAICRSLKPSALSRRTSRILRTGNLACPTVDLLARWQIDHGNGWSTRLTSAGLPCSGMVARHGPESWPGMRRNRGPAWTGTVARHQPEYAVFAILRYDQNLFEPESLASEYGEDTLK